MTAVLNRASLTAAALTLSLGCAAPHEDDRPVTASVEELFEVDRAFARATAENRIEGWMSYFADDAARLYPGKVVRGLEGIREADSALFGDETLDLKWEPTDAGLFRDSAHGFTTGRYELIKTEDGTPPSGWKVILDTGSPDPPADEREAG